MSMQVHRLATYLSASEALTVIELLDQLRDLLMASYSEQIEHMLRGAQASDSPLSSKDNEDV